MKAYRYLGALAAGGAMLLSSGEASAQRVYVQAGGPGYYGTYEPMRLRLAIGGTAGGFVGTSLDNGFLFGLWGQIGLQINRLIAVYYQAHLMLGGYVRPGDTLIGGFAYNEAMVDFTIQDVFQIGIGPSFDVISSCDQGSNLCGSIGYFGADLRIGVALGQRRRWRRAGFMLGVDIHPTFIPDATNSNTYVDTAVLLTIGGGFY